MKLASLNNATRDGRLAIVSRNLSRAVEAPVQTLRDALDNWDAVAPTLEALYRELNEDAVTGSFDFDPEKALAPLPRAHQWLDASAFLRHGKLMMKAFKLDADPQGETPLMYQGGSDDFLGARAHVPFPKEEHGIDFEGEFGIILGDTPMGVTPQAARNAVKLLVLINDWSLRALAPDEMRTGFGWLHSKPSTSFGLVAVTPDELGAAWRDGRVELPLQIYWNGGHFGHPHGQYMDFTFYELVAHAAKTRRLRAGTIIGSGTVSGPEPEKIGSACIAERRGLEMIANGGAPTTPFMRFGDRVRIDVLDHDGQTIFGAIDQIVVRA